MFVKITKIRIPCLFYTMTNYQCPGCGITRMFMALGEGNVVKAFHYNGAVLILLPFFLILTVKMMVKYIKSGTKTCSKIDSFCLITMCVILIIFNLFRNL